MKKAYFKFYDQLPEPIRGWAKENWDSKRAKQWGVPKFLPSSLTWGFVWDKSPQGNDFWYFVYNRCESKSLLTDAKKKFPELFGIKPKPTKAAKPAKTVSRIKLKIVKRKDGSWMFQPVGGNGEKLNDRYASKSNAVRAAKAFKAQMANATIIDEKGNKIEFDL